jgi:hypothetical protein
VVCCLLCVPLAAGAGEILDSSAELDNGVYTLALTARIDAPPATVLRLITDYDRLTEINSSLTESRTLLEHSPEKHRVHTVIRACILFFCRSVTQVQDITRDASGRVEALILPALSDFRQGVARWELAPAGTGTIMRFNAMLEPAFWVPPLIGPWLFERQLSREVRESATIMEARARADGAR